MSPGGQCAAKGVWAYLTAEINRLLEGITLKDMLENNICANAEK